jgi:pantothenate kinase
MHEETKHFTTLKSTSSNILPGKTTLATKIVSALNARHQSSSPALHHATIAAFLPLDGFHLTRAQLSALPNPSNAHARRGAAFTFDAPAFLKLVEKLREPLLPETSTIWAPSFDHAVKDPKPKDIGVAASVRVVVFEGNYLSLGASGKAVRSTDAGGMEGKEVRMPVAPEWKAAAELMDELWFVEVEEEVARKRLIQRHVKSGVAKDEEEAARRADENDLVNGREIVEGRLEVQEIIHSREDDDWKPEAETT